MGGALLVLALGLAVVFGDDIITINDNNEVIENKDNQNESIEAYKTIVTSKLKHYYAEEILCSLADSIWDVDKHNEILNSLKDVDIKLSGTVNRVSNNMDGCYIVFTQKRADGLKDGWAVITCYVYDKDEIDDAMKLKKGDNITLIGHCGKYPVTGLSLYDCYIQ